MEQIWDSVEAMILVVFRFLDYLICFISVALKMDCLSRRYAAAKNGEFYTLSKSAPVQLRAAYLPITGGKRKTYLRRRTRTTKIWKWAAEGIFHRMTGSA